MTAIFDRVVANLEPPQIRLDLSGLPRSFVHGLIDRARRIVAAVHADNYVVRRQVHLDFVANPTVNAFATSESGVDVVGIYIGAVASLLRVFARLLGDPKAFPDVGRPEAEVVTAACPLNAPSVLLNSDWPEPVDAVRAEFARLLATTALDFLVGHEVTHLLNGHLRPSHGFTRIFEAVGSAETSDEGMRSQVCELDADVGGFQRALRIARARADAEDGEEARRHARFAAFGSDEKILFSTLYAAHFLIRTFDQQGWDERRLEFRSHPPAPLRQLAFADFAMTQSIGSGLLSLTPRQCREIASNVVRQAEEAHHRLTGSWDPKAFDAYDEHAPLNQHYWRLKARYPSIRDSMLENMRGDRLWH